MVFSLKKMKPGEFWVMRDKGRHTDGIVVIFPSKPQKIHWRERPQSQIYTDTKTSNELSCWLCDVDYAEIWAPLFRRKFGWLPPLGACEQVRITVERIGRKGR